MTTTRPAAVAPSPAGPPVRSQFARGFLVLLSGSVIGKVAGIVRESVFAAAFGTGPVAAGFKTAQTAALVSANLFTGDLLASAFTPRYAAAAREDPQAAGKLLWSYLVWLGGVLLIVATALFLLRGPIVAGIIPGAPVPVRFVATGMLGTLGWCVPLYGVSSLAGYALGTAGDYAAASLRSTLQTVGLLVGTVGALMQHRVETLADGYVAAWVVYAAWCVFRLWRRGLLSPAGPRASLAAGGLVGRSLLAVLPLAAVPVALQAAAVLERVFASHGPTALIASADYAHTISDSVVTLLSVPLGFVGLTQFSKLEERHVRPAVRRLVGAVLLVGLPASLVLVPLSRLVVALMYHRGAFGSEALDLTATVTSAMFVGVGVQILGYTLTRVLSGRGRNRAVLVITLAAVAAQMGVQALSVALQQPAFLGWGVTAYGVVLTVGGCVLLGASRTILGVLARVAPALAVSGIALALLAADPWWSALVVAAAWFLNALCVPALRSIFIDAVSTIRGRRAGVTT